MKKVMLIAAALLTLLTACGPKTPAQTPTPVPTPTPAVAAIPPINGWAQEILRDQPGDTLVRYSVTDGQGNQTTLLELTDMTEEHDLDGDGEDEILVYLSAENVASIGIYDLVEGELLYRDVNALLGCQSAAYTGNIGNIQGEYANCIEAGFQEEVGQSRFEVYSYDGSDLVYQCTLDEALLK